MQKPIPIKPLEFDVPVEATRGGELTLTFSGPPGLAAPAAATRSPKSG